MYNLVILIKNERTINMDVKEEQDDIPKAALWKIVHSEKRECE